MSAVACKELSVQWPQADAPALHGISAQAPRGQWTAVVGPNGAGKSTLLRAIARLLPPKTRCHGDIVGAGRTPAQWPREAWSRHHAWLGQGEQGGLDLRAIDVVRLGRLPHQSWWPQAPSAQDESCVRDAMQRTACWALRDTPLAAMSGGERQRVRLARLWAVQAELLLQDEPLANLDPPHQADWLEWMHAITAQGGSVISVLHELNIALRADHLWLIHPGRLQAQGHINDPHMRQALVDTFDGRIRLHAVDGQWVALPVVRA